MEQIPDIDIGIVTIDYNTEGAITHYRFSPLLELTPDKEVMHQLQFVQPSADIDIVKQSADTILAAWFSKVTTIELADREDYEVRSSIIECDKHDNGLVKRCRIRYRFVKRQ